jgi:glycosyltransferase involved in cell wall biosynthesis
LLLLVGNDLRNKGLSTLLQTLTQCRDLPWHLCVVGSDSSAGYSAEIEQRQLQGRVTFAGETADILTYYSAADIYVEPSLEDSFNLPALEAMACGLPVILSSSAGMSDYVKDGVDALLLRNSRTPTNLPWHSSVYWPIPLSVPLSARMHRELPHSSRGIAMPRKFTVSFRDAAVHRA